MTRRCKASESAFGSVTQSLGEVPDPASVLATAMEQIHIQQQQLGELRQAVEVLNQQKAMLEKNSTKKESKSSDSGLGRAEKEELIQLRREVAEYEVEFRSLKNQDITIRKLEARITEFQEGGKEEFESNLESAKQELAETEGRRTAEALEREAAMERRVQTLELQLKAEKAGLAATNVHLLEASEGSGEREAAWEAQRRILIDDAERVRLNLHEATRERDFLRLKVAAIEGGRAQPVAPSSGGIQMADLLSEREAYEAEVSELSLTLNSLREEMSLKENGMEEDRRSLQANVETLEREIRTLKSDLSTVEAHLAEAPSQALVDSMKRELRILKRLEYNAEDPDLNERDPEMTGGNEDKEKDLESVLVAKLRRVEAEVVKARNEKAEMVKECEQLRQEIAALEKEKTDSENTIATLEQDLDKAISTTASPMKIPKKKIDPVVSEGDPATLQSVLDPNAPPPPPLSVTTEQDKGSSAAEKAADDHSVATIIMAQRDRLRARCDALEAERDSFKRELQAQVDAAESLKADNSKLFEKMRYLQSYNNNSSNRAGAYQRNPSRDLDLEALEQRYEASVDPFRQFSRSERQRKLQEMSPMERSVFVVAKTFLGSKEMRTFLFFYILSLHLLVFMTTYHWSHSDSGSCTIAANEHLSHLPPLTDKSAEEIVNDLSGGGD